MNRNPFSKYGRLTRILPGTPAGKTFFVVPTGSALIPELQDQFPIDEDGVVRVYTDLASAVAAVVSGRGDVVAVMPGAFTISTVVSSSASDWKLVGVGTPGAAMLTGSAASILTLTGDNVEVANMGFTIASTKKAITLTGSDFCNIHDNVFYSTVGGAASHFIHMLTTACNHNKIANNQFVSNLDVTGGAITQTSHITLLGRANLIERNLFVSARNSTANGGAVTDAILSADTATPPTDIGNIIRENSFTEAFGATFTNGVDYSTSYSGSVLCVDNNFLLGTAGNAVVPAGNGGSFGNNVADGTV